MRLYGSVHPFFRRSICNFFELTWPLIVLGQIFAMRDVYVKDSGSLVEMQKMVAVVAAVVVVIII